jgi:hypothetical protein
MFAHPRKIGIEGVVSKVRDSVYASGRGSNWVKKTCAQRETLTIAGFALCSKAGARSRLLVDRCLGYSLANSLIGVPACQAFLRREGEPAWIQVFASADIADRRFKENDLTTDFVLAEAWQFAKPNLAGAKLISWQAGRSCFREDPSPPSYPAAGQPSLKSPSSSRSRADRSCCPARR